MSEDQYEACDCPLCRDGVPDEVLELIMASAASGERVSMTREEFSAWLYAREPGG